MNKFAILTSITCSTVYGQPLMEETKLTSHDAAIFDGFGAAIAMNRSLTAVGSRGSDTINIVNSGSVYLYESPSGNFVTKLTPADGNDNSDFGRSIAMSETLIAIGAPGDNTNGSFSGAVYVFDLSSGDLLHKLLPNDGEPNDSFGYSVSLSNGIVAVGAYRDDDNGNESGSAYLFNASTGTQISKILPSNGSENDRFGASVSIQNGILAVGAWGYFLTERNAGIAYIFDAAKGTELFILQPDDVDFYDRFGISVDIDQNLVAVGSMGYGPQGTGAVFVYDINTGALVHQLDPTSNPGNIDFGYSLDFNDGIIAVGARGDETNGPLSGSAYLFNSSTGSQIAKLLPSDGAEWDHFSDAEGIAIQNGYVSVGSRGDDDNGLDFSGSMYIFNINCTADLTGDFTLDFFDISAFLTLFAAQDPIADFTGDGAFDFFDISAFLTLFALGCP